MTLEDLAVAVNFDPADVAVILASLDVDADNIPDDAATAVHRILNPNSERTVPQLYCPGLDPDTGTGATKMR